MGNSCGKRIAKNSRVESIHKDYKKHQEKLLTYARLISVKELMQNKIIEQ